MERGVVLCHEETEQDLTVQDHGEASAQEQVPTGSSVTAADAVWVAEQAGEPVEVQAWVTVEVQAWVTVEVQVWITGGAMVMLLLIL